MEDQKNAIERAIEAAGGAVAVAYKLGIATSATVNAWASRKSVPAGYISTLCALGDNVVKPQEILDLMAERVRARKDRAAA